MNVMDAKQVISGLGALAHETRLSVFRMLVERGPDGLPAGVIAQRLDIPPSSLTFHLQHLTQARLISQRRLSRHDPRRTARLVGEEHMKRRDRPYLQYGYSAGRALKVS